MQIVFARSGYSATGGAERYLQRLVAGLSSKGVSSILLNDGAWPPNEWPGERIVTLSGESPQKFAEQVARERLSHPDSLLFSFDRIPATDIFRAGDGIHTAYLKRQSMGESRFASWFRSKRRLHREICALEKKLFTENPSLRVICNSQMVARELSDLYAFDQERTHVIYNGFTPRPWSDDDRTTARREIREQLGIPQNAPIILFVGSGWKRKGASRLAAAFQKMNHPDAHLILVGKGHLETSFGTNIHLTGGIKNPRPYFLASDLFALPTLYDPFSNACLEAAAYGLPVLTTDGNGFAEALANFPGAGEVIPHNSDLAQWVNALTTWLQNEHPTQPLKDLVDANSMEKNIHETTLLLKRLASQKSLPAT